jgi:hypothetical protein
MSHFISKSALAAIALFLPSTLAGVIGKRMNPNENVLLTYCSDSNNNIINAQMGYFSGTPNGMPDATVIIPGPIDLAISDSPEIAIWEGPNPLTGVFSDGNHFTSFIRFAPAPAGYAGLGQNKEGYFSCYAYDPSGPQYYYTDSAGLTCLESYICNHTPPSTDPVFMTFAPSTASISLENTNSLMTAGAVLSLASNTWSSTTGICEPGNSQTIDDKGCSISFTCNAVSNGELQNMQNFLVGVVAKSPSFVTYSTVVNPQDGPCQSQDGCPTNPPPEYWYTTMPQSLNMNTNYVETPLQPGGSPVSNFMYEITCPAQGCFACYLLEEFLAGAALVPDLGAAAGVLALGATAACQQSAGC